MARTLIDDTHKMLRERPLNCTYRKIARSTGLSMAWVQDFACYKREGASTRRVEKLRNYLLRIEALALKHQA